MKTLPLLLFSLAIAYLRAHATLRVNRLHGFLKPVSVNHDCDGQLARALGDRDDVGLRERAIER